MATVVGVQNGVEVYNVTMAVSAGGRRRGRYFFPNYMPTAAGVITWTATLDDGDPDVDMAVAMTEVTAGRPPEDDHAAESPTAQPVVTAASAESPAAQPAVTEAAPSAESPAAQPVVTTAAPSAEPPGAQPVATTAATTANGPCTGTHLVRAGENLFRIGYNCGFSVGQMATANGIAYPYTIHPGQMLRYP